MEEAARQGMDEAAREGMEGSLKASQNVPLVSLNLVNCWDKILAGETGRDAKSLAIFV